MTIQWNISFVRAAHDLEVDVFVSFFNLLYLVRMRQDGENKLCCSPPVMGCSLLAHFIVSLHVSCNVGTPFPWKSIWRTGSLEGGLFCLVVGPRKDSYYEQS